MTKQPELFPVKKMLSPRLRWMKRHKVLLYVSMKDDPANRLFLAAFDYGDWEGYHDAADYFAQEIAANGDRRIGKGKTDDEALLDLCEKRRVAHWTVEELHLPPSDRGPRLILWDYLHNEHKLTLLDSELDEVIALSCACRRPPGVLH